MWAHLYNIKLLMQISVCSLDQVFLPMLTLSHKPDTLIHKHNVKGIKGVKELNCVSAPRYNKTLGHPVDKCDTYCYLVGFDEKGHSGNCYYRCANCKTFICHVCKTEIYLYLPTISAEGGTFK